MEKTERMSKLTAQVAVEAVVNSPDAFDLATRRAVLTDATNAGVADFFLDMLWEVV